MAGGTTSGQNVNAVINVLLQNAGVTISPNTVEVIDTVLPGLAGATSPNPPVLIPPIVNQPANPATFKADGTILPASVFCSTADCQNSRASFAVTVTEDHIDTWRTQAQYYNNGIGVTLNPTNVLYTFSGMLPGSIISNCTVTATQTGSTTPSGLWNLTGSGIGSTAGTTTMVAEPLLPTNMGILETLTLRCGTSTTNPAYLVGASTGGASTPITVTMSMYPFGNAINTAPGTDATTGGFPRYAVGTSVGPVTVINFVGAVTGQTTMLIPWATASGAAAPAAGTFNTGVVIANTTKDATPFGSDIQGGA
jgi:hypothetical protein